MATIVRNMKKDKMKKTKKYVTAKGYSMILWPIRNQDENRKKSIPSRSNNVQ